jgi:magnesium-protoporphyrin O-methyltransferase
MDNCGCEVLASMFDRGTAKRDRDRYHSKGADRTTRMLLDLIRSSHVEGSTILDVGGGIGVIDQELLNAGAVRAVLVDASPAYLEVARDEARKSNLADRMEFVDGDFVQRAADIGGADIVTLDRVICCYPDAANLVGLSAARARRMYAIVLPRDRSLIRVAIRLLNFGFRLRRKGYRTYAHANRQIDELIAVAGLRPRTEVGTYFWRVDVYDRATGAP